MEIKGAPRRCDSNAKSKDLGAAQKLWEVSETALCGLPLSPQYWDVLPAGYEPPLPG